MRGVSDSDGASVPWPTRSNSLPQTATAAIDADNGGEAAARRCAGMSRRRSRTWNWSPRISAPTTRRPARFCTRIRITGSASSPMSYEGAKVHLAARSRTVIVDLRSGRRRHRDDRMAQAEGARGRRAWHARGRPGLQTSSSAWPPATTRAASPVAAPRGRHSPDPHRGRQPRRHEGFRPLRWLPEGSARES